MPSMTVLETYDEIDLCSDADTLLLALRECASDILGNLERMAVILRRLDAMGVEVTIDHALIPYIRMIANGQLSASCLIACAADPELLGRAVTLPLSIQEQIANDEPFLLLNPSGEKHLAKPSEMNKKELLQVFKKCKVRDDQEQEHYLNGCKNKSDIRVGQQLPYRRTGRSSLVDKAGQVVDGSTRCKDCGVKLLPGAECLSCKIQNDHGKQRDELQDHIDWLMRYLNKRRLAASDKKKLDDLYMALTFQFGDEY